MGYDLKCPYCDAELQVCHDDGEGYDEDVLHQMECHHCDKTFGFTTSISFYYEPRKTDCLNDGNHVWKTTLTYPRRFSKMQCHTCWEKRDPTPEEWKGIWKKETQEEQEMNHEGLQKEIQKSQS